MGLLRSRVLVQSPAKVIDTELLYMIARPEDHPAGFQCPGQLRTTVSSTGQTPGNRFSPLRVPWKPGNGASRVVRLLPPAGFTLPRGGLESML